MDGPSSDHVGTGKNSEQVTTTPHLPSASLAKRSPAPSSTGGNMTVDTIYKSTRSQPILTLKRLEVVAGPEDPKVDLEKKARHRASGKVKKSKKHKKSKRRKENFISKAEPGPSKKRALEIAAQTAFTQTEEPVKKSVQVQTTSTINPQQDMQELVDLLSAETGSVIGLKFNFEQACSETNQQLDFLCVDLRKNASAFNGWAAKFRRFKSRLEATGELPKNQDPVLMTKLMRRDKRFNGLVAAYMGLLSALRTLLVSVAKILAIPMQLGQLTAQNHSLRSHEVPLPLILYALRSVSRARQVVILKSQT